MPIILPKKIVDVEVSRHEPLLFLAGPINGGGDWQAEMYSHIYDYAPNANVACPARWDSTHKLSRHFHEPFSDASNRQLVWERHYLKLAGVEKDVNGCVIFWLPQESLAMPHQGPEPYAMDTRREIGKFTAYAETLKGIRLIIGGDRKFHGLDVILFELSEAFGYEVIFYTDMNKAAYCAVYAARNLRK